MQTNQVSIPEQQPFSKQKDIWRFSTIEMSRKKRNLDTMVAGCCGDSQKAPDRSQKKLRNAKDSAPKNVGRSGHNKVPAGHNSQGGIFRVVVSSKTTNA